MTIAIVDDDLIERNITINYVEKYVKTNNIKCKIDSFTNAFELLDYLEKYQGFDIYLLDICMDGFNGIDLAKQIRLRKEYCDIVFITTSKDYALDSYNVDAFQYIVKPLSVNKFERVLDKVITHFSDEEKFIVIKTTLGYQKINLKEVLYIESYYHHYSFYLNDDIFITNMSYNEIKELIHNNSNFLKCHRSYYVNLDRINKIENRKIYFLNGDVVNISRRLVKYFYNYYFSYLNILEQYGD